MSRARSDAPTTVPTTPMPTFLIDPSQHRPPPAGSENLRPMTRMLVPSPRHNETSTEFQLRARMLPVNDRWRHEPIGLCSGKTLLEEHTPSSVCITWPLSACIA